jgi:carboxyl-terminal processing protease
MEQKNNNAKTKKGLLIILLALCLAISFIAGYFFNSLTMGKDYAMAKKVMQVIKNNSIFLEDYSPDKVADSLVNGLLANDKYAEYYSKEELETDKQEAEGNYQGIGIILYSNTKRVFKILGNSPAQKAGFVKGDEILSVSHGGVYTPINSSSQFNAIVNELGLGESITIEVLGSGGVRSVHIEKQDFLVSYVNYIDSGKTMTFEGDGLEELSPVAVDKENTVLDDKTAIIVLEQFEGGVVEQFKKALDFMVERGRTNLILDLRDNGGGYMDILLEISSFLINNNGKSKNDIVYVKKTKQSYSLRTKENNFYSQIKDTVIIANHNTASASECLIGAMLYYKDMGFTHDKLLVTYNPARSDYSTYGKGIMQSTYGLVSGGAVKLTTGLIYQPDRTTCIHETGIKPTLDKNCVLDYNALDRAMEIFANG